ncbi:MAG TPA: DUF5777 family beta-barrel protein [Bacteroidia bacterium]|nr:DUF5777 family beta-barrel protein [Bacteroidia bacterium]
MNSSAIKRFQSFLFVLFLVFTPKLVLSQDDIWSGIDSSSTDTDKDLVIATFKSTRVINFQNVECVGKRTLDFRISHRFGEWNTGAYNFYGIDGPANIRLGLEYSPNGRFMFGIGRSSYRKELDGFLKYRWLRQTTDDAMPVSVTFVSSIFMTRLKDPQAQSTGFDKYHYLSDRLSFSNQVIIGRKFSRNFSMQIAPVMVHYNLAEDFTDLNDSYFITTAARLKVSKRIAVTGEYGLSLASHTQKDVANTLGFGIDIETGGHVFQLFLTNSFGITENQFLPFTTNSWADKGFRLGFNVSRVFSL